MSGARSPTAVRSPAHRAALHAALLLLAIHAAGVPGRADGRPTGKRLPAGQQQPRRQRAAAGGASAGRTPPLWGTRRWAVAAAGAVTGGGTSSAGSFAGQQVGRSDSTGGTGAASLGAGARVRCGQNLEDIEQLRPPQFLLVSCPKCGSTALYYHGLCTHERIDCRAKTKETNWLRRHDVAKFPSADAFYNEYVSKAFLSLAPKEQRLHGRVARENPVTPDASIWYYMSERALTNAAAVLPCARLIWILRNPLPRARSLYFHTLASRPQRLAIPGALQHQPFYSLADMLEPELGAMERCAVTAGTDPTSGLRAPFLSCLDREAPSVSSAAGRQPCNLLRSGLYAFYIQAWLARFPPRQMLYVDYAALRRHPQSTMERILQFLSLRNPKTPTAFAGMQQQLQSKHQAGIDTVAAREAHPGLEALPASLRLRAQRVLLPHMRALTQLTGEGQRWNLSSANE